MPAGAESLSGPRLEFVVRALPGTVTTYKHAAPLSKDDIKALKDKGLKLTEEGLKNTVTEVIEEAGYLVFLPTGSAYRLSKEQLVKRGFARQPNIIGFEQANDTKSAVGRFKLARFEAEKQRAWAEMEKEVIAACTSGTGKYETLLGDNYNKDGKLEKEAA